MVTTPFQPLPKKTVPGVDFVPSFSLAGGRLLAIGKWPLGIWALDS
jgi:hypothetical protein